VPQLEAIYRSSARRAFAAVWLFRAAAAVAVPYIAAAFWRLSQSDELYDSVVVARKGLVLSEAALGLMALVTVAVRLGALIAFVAWLYQVTKNLSALGIVVLRVWRASDPESAPGSAQGWPLLYAWWGAFLALSAAGFAVWFARAPGGPPELLTRTQVWAYLCSAIATIVMALLAVRVVREIERRQTEKSQLQAFA